MKHIVTVLFLLMCTVHNVQCTYRIGHFRNGMSFDPPTQFMADMAELRNNRDDDADVALHCQGEVIMAHSCVLGIRYA